MNETIQAVVALIPKEADWALSEELVVEPEPSDDGMHYAVGGTVEGLAAALPHLVRVLVGRLSEADFYAVIQAGTAKFNPTTHSALDACQAELIRRLLPEASPGGPHGAETTP